MNKSSRFIQFMFFIACMAFGMTVHADVKIKTRTTMSGGHTSEGATYIKGKRQRSEQGTGTVEMINITQCDLRRSLQINQQSKTYMVDVWSKDDNQNSDTPAQVAASKTNPQQPTVEKKGGLVTTTITARDTGERKKMFGYTARHIISTMETVSSPDACTPVKNKMETDGWYIDAEFAFDCMMDRYKNWQPTGSQKPDCRDRYQTKQIGAARTGYPVYTKTTMYGDNGEVAHTYVSEVIELSPATLDAALFDVPADYREVKNSTELYAAMASSSSGMTGANRSSGVVGGDNDTSANTNSGMNANVRGMAKATSNASTEVGAKKPGVVRLGLANVKTSAVGEGMNAAELASAIGNSLGEYLKSPNVELVQLEARLPSQIDLEAKGKECDFVIYTNVGHKKGGGGFGKMFGKNAGMLGNVASMGGYGGYGGAVAGQVASTVIVTAATMSANVKSKDELTLDIKLQAPGNATPAVTKQLKAKAKSDGEDIISPLIEQAAQAILYAATKQ